MSTFTKSPSTLPRRSQRRIWHAPGARTTWLWLILAILMSGGVYLWYLKAKHASFFVGPRTDPLRLFGIFAFLLVLFTVAYSLRRRFMRGLPGMTGDWLQMHIWFGIAALIIAILHENFLFLVDCTDKSCITQYAAGTSALFALMVLVASGIFGRLLDFLGARFIAGEASTNGAGIVQSVEERLLELEYTVERLCAGKSELFKGYCMKALEVTHLSSRVPSLAAQERVDFEHAVTTLREYIRLKQSLHKQQFAKQILHGWRTIHIVIATLALLVICLHSGVELLKMAVQFIRH